MKWNKQTKPFSLQSDIFFILTQNITNIIVLTITVYYWDFQLMINNQSVASSNKNSADDDVYDDDVCIRRIPHIRHIRHTRMNYKLGQQLLVCYTPHTPHTPHNNFQPCANHRWAPLSWRQSVSKELQQRASVILLNKWIDKANNCLNIDFISYLSHGSFH